MMNSKLTNYKQIVLILFLISLCSIGKIEAQWTLEKCPTKDNLNSISMIDKNTGWIVGDNGTILSRINNLWREYQKFTSANLTSVFMIDKNDGWAVGTGGTIIHFDGKRWKHVTSPSYKKLLSVCFKDSENGIATGEFGTILLYKNGIWKSLESELTGNLYTASYENNYIWIGGWRESVDVPVIKIGVDDKLEIINRFDHLSSVAGIYFVNPDNGWAVGCPSFILRYDGTKWERWGVNEVFSSLNSVFFSDESNGITVGYKGTILIYSGNNWVKQNTPVDTKLNGSAISGTSYYAVGDNGTIISWKQIPDDILSGVEPDSLKIEFYPNPADEVLNYILTDESTSNASIISILDLYGQKIFQKKINQGEEGTISQISTLSFNNGIYFLQVITTEGKSVTGKFVIKH